MKRLILILSMTLLALLFLAMGDGASPPVAAQEGPTSSPHGGYSPSTSNCTVCHKPHTEDVSPQDACFDCHPAVVTHQENECVACHEPHGVSDNAALINDIVDGNPVEFDGANFADEPTGVCYTCHTTTEFHSPAATESHYDDRDCTECHPHDAGFTLNPSSCTVCHGAPPETGAHLRHVADDIALTCSDCHQRLREFTDRGHRNGQVDFADRRQLSDTRVCNVCHGDTAGVQEAKLAWASGGPIENCLGCHNTADPGVLKGKRAPAKDAFWEVNGHGQVQDDGKDVDCQACHDPESPHFGAAANARLVSDPEKLCLSCHEAPVSASVGANAADEQAPHGAAGDCDACHDPHGSVQPVMVRQTQAMVCGACHEDRVDPEVGFAAHASDEDIVCSACHDPHTPVAAPAQVERMGCESCHDDLPDPDSLSHPHQPFADEQCAACHPSFHENPDQPLLAETQAATCNSCHEDHGQTIKQPHPEEAAGQCLFCHDGHGSDQPKLLVSGEQAICESCHAAQFDEDHTFVEHTAGKLPACTSCHSPHEPKTSGKQVLETCSQCHDDLLADPAKSTHPPVQVGECSRCHSEFHGQRTSGLAEPEACTTCHELADGRVEHQPAAKGECTSCHVPHSSSHPSLLNAGIRQLCAECHPNQAAVYRTSSHAPRLNDQCASCHVPHSGEVDNLLKSRTNRLCQSCHSGLPHGFHPVSGNGLSCISCHAPHGSMHPADLRAAGDALCLSCHKLSSASSGG